jgi:hypothetical protein
VSGEAGRLAYYMLWSRGAANTTKKISKIPIFRFRGSADLIARVEEGKVGMFSGRGPSAALRMTPLEGSIFNHFREVVSRRAGIIRLIGLCMEKGRPKWAMAVGDFRHKRASRSNSLGAF